MIFCLINLLYELILYYFKHYNYEVLTNLQRSLVVEGFAGLADRAAGQEGRLLPVRRDLGQVQLRLQQLLLGLELRFLNKINVG